MSLTYCPDCQKPISDRALFCPKCGFSFPNVQPNTTEAPKRGCITKEVVQAMIEAYSGSLMEKKFLSKADAAALLSVSTDTIERRAIPWQDAPMKYKIRIKFVCLDKDSRRLPRFFREDVEALLETPKPNPSRPRKLFEK